ncbi:DNA-damage inducible protein [Babesia caballi]|uniref:DNA-damage inducible protein n=1 Tax=Babesia caballi TaxID=5871 RepID=A0AAV4LUQ6_BABCB|nr:DNA-damage inducible protein [Babesia caballi]
MGLWAQIDVALCCNEFHSVALNYSTWYRLGFRAFKQLSSECIASLSINAGAVLPGDEGWPANLPEALLPIASAAPDYDTYLTRPFFAEEKNHKVVVNEVARFRAEVPALPSILASSALFVEVELISYPVVADGVIADDKLGGNGGQPSVVDSKVFRIGNLATGRSQRRPPDRAAASHEYYPCNFDDEHVNAVAHLVVRTAPLKFAVAMPLMKPLSREPCSRYNEWRKQMSHAAHDVVKGWFVESSYQEEGFYDDAKHISPTSIVRPRRRGRGADSGEAYRSESAAELVVLRFIEQILDGDDGCRTIFGLGNDAEPSAATRAGSASAREALLGDEQALSIGARALYYIYAKILSEAAMSLGMRGCGLEQHETADPTGNGQPSSVTKAVSGANVHYYHFRNNTDDGDTLNGSILSGGCLPRRRDVLSDNNISLTTFDKSPVSSTDHEVNQRDRGQLFRPITNDSLQMVLCDRLNSVAEGLGIRRCGDRKVLIAVANGSNMVFDEIDSRCIDPEKFDESMALMISKVGAPDAGSADTLQLSTGISAWLCLEWERFTGDLTRCERAHKRFSNTYCDEQRSLLKWMGEPAVDEAALVAMLRSMKITDEHHFFAAACFPFVRHTPSPPLPPESPKKPPSQARRHLVVLVHGYHGYPVTMRFFRFTLSAYARRTDVLVSRFFFEDAECPIEEKATLLAREIDIHIRRKIGKHRLARISFIAHSMGGLVVRAAIRHMDEYRDLLHALVSLSTPHVGVTRMPNKVFEAGCWIYASCVRSTCLRQMMLSDEDSVDECLLYKMSGDACISGFKSLKLVGILQDHISPAYSCLLDPSLLSDHDSTVELMCSRLMDKLRDLQVDRFYVDYENVSKHVHGRIVTLYLEDDWKLPKLRQLIQEQLNLPAGAQKLFLDGNLLVDDGRTLVEAGLKNNDVVYALCDLPVTSAVGVPAAASEGVAEYDAKLRREAAALLERMHPGSLEMEVLRESLPEVHDAVLTRDLQKVVAALYKKNITAVQERLDQQVRLYKAQLNPLDPESQRVIQEAINRERIEESLEHARQLLPELAELPKALRIAVQINGVEVRAVVDTGAQVSVMSELCARRCNLHSLIDYRYKGVARGVSKGRITGRLHLATMKIGGSPIPFSCVIIDSVYEDFLLGLDVLWRHRCSINLTAKTMRLGNQTVSFVSDQDPTRFPVPGYQLSSASTAHVASQGGSTSSRAPHLRTAGASVGGSVSSRAPAARANPVVSQEKVARGREDEDGADGAEEDAEHVHRAGGPGGHERGGAQQREPERLPGETREEAHVLPDAAAVLPGPARGAGHVQDHDHQPVDDEEDGHDQGGELGDSEAAEERHDRVRDDGGRGREEERLVAHVQHLQRLLQTRGAGVHVVAERHQRALRVAALRVVRDVAGHLGVPKTVSTAILTGKRFYNPPTRKSWSKQHPDFRTRRPLVEPYNLGRLHPEKEWWKLPRKGLSPQTFMGFPDVAQLEKRGGALYAHLMDGHTLSMVLYRCIEKEVKDEDIWRSLTLQALKLAMSLDPHLVSLLFLYFSRSACYDNRFVATFTGRILATLSQFTLRECTNVLLAMENERFLHELTKERVTRHAEALCLADARAIPVEDALRMLAVVDGDSPEVGNILVALGEIVEVSDLSTVDEGVVVEALDAACGLGDRVDRLCVAKLFDDVCARLEGDSDCKHSRNLALLNALATFHYRRPLAIELIQECLRGQAHTANVVELCRYMSLAGEVDRILPATAVNPRLSMTEAISSVVEALKVVDQLMEDPSLGVQFITGCLRSSKPLQPAEVALLAALLEQPAQLRQSDVLKLYEAVTNARSVLDVGRCQGEYRNVGEARVELVATVGTTRRMQADGMCRTCRFHRLQRHGEVDVASMVGPLPLAEAFRRVSEGIGDLATEDRVSIIEFCARHAHFGRSLLAILEAKPALVPRNAASSIAVMELHDR